MGLLLSASHQILEFACRKAFQCYRQQANDLEMVQRQKLDQFLKQHTSQSLSYEQFVEKYPLTSPDIAIGKKKLNSLAKVAKTVWGRGKLFAFNPPVVQAKR